MNVRTTFPCYKNGVAPRRPLSILIALSLSSLSAGAFAEETLVVSAEGGGVEQESSWGPAPTVAAKRSATGTKTDTPIEKTRSLFPW